MKFVDENTNADIIDINMGCPVPKVTKCDAGARWLLLPDPTPREKIRIAVLHLDRLANLKGENTAVREMRKHLAWYLKGLPDSAAAKNLVMDLTTRSAVVTVLEEYVKSVEQFLEQESLGSLETGEFLVH